MSLHYFIISLPLTTNLQLTLSKTSSIFLCEIVLKCKTQYHRVEWKTLWQKRKIAFMKKQSWQSFHYIKNNDVLRFQKLTDNECFCLKLNFDR